jgi:hypothetical protein
MAGLMTIIPGRRLRALCCRDLVCVCGEIEPLERLATLSIFGFSAVAQADGLDSRRRPAGTRAPRRAAWADGPSSCSDGGIEGGDRRSLLTFGEADLTHDVLGLSVGNKVFGI